MNEALSSQYTSLQSNETIGTNSCKMGMNAMNNYRKINHMTQPTPKPKLRTRALSVGHLRAFEAVARHLNFRVASEELALTQSAVSRQIQALEDEIGVSLFLRHTRSVEMTGAGSQLLRAVMPSLENIDGAVRQIRRTAGRKIVSISTWASFSTQWLIPRMEAFQHDHPDIDLRIEATDSAVNLETSDVDLVLRYAKPSSVPKHARRLFGEQLAVVASPWLMKSSRSIKKAADLSHFSLIEADHDNRFKHNEWLTWERWLVGQKQPDLEPKRWMYFNYSHQIVQAALTGQGVALCRMPLISDHLAKGDLIELLPTERMETPLAYWLIVGPRSHLRPEVQAFCEWLISQAAITSAAMGET
jgi:LysR family transcriptional regulator, glycine cleavage system transcriptional activator